MGKRIIPLLLLALFSASTFGQKYFTRNGYIRFFSATPMENIEAVNNQASCILDIETGEVVSKVLIQAFQFEKALMQEHFNENYVESDKFPQAVFKGKIINLDKIEINKQGSKQVQINADLTIHGVTKSLEIPATILNNNGEITATAIFTVKPPDFEIKIPKAVANNIAKEIEVTVKFNLEPVKK